MTRTVQRHQIELQAFAANCGANAFNIYQDLLFLELSTGRLWPVGFVILLFAVLFAIYRLQ